jgi:Fur family ferric uptake transcriptional regulator
MDNVILNFPSNLIDRANVKFVMNKSSNSDQARECIRRTGARVTVARVRVLAFLLTQKAAVSHNQIDAALSKELKMDRVTLYRALEWLTDVGLLHKVISVDRAWLFRFNTNDIERRQHAHFKCNGCSKVVCLDKFQSTNEIPQLPVGYRGLQIEITVKGLCSQCA